LKSGTQRDKQRDKLRRRNKKIKKEGAECRGDTYLFELRFKGYLKRSLVKKQKGIWCQNGQLGDNNCGLSQSCYQQRHQQVVAGNR